MPRRLTMLILATTVMAGTATAQDEPRTPVRQSPRFGGAPHASVECETDDAVDRLQAMTGTQRRYIAALERDNARLRQRLAATGR